MSRRNIELTTEWQKISARKAVFTLFKVNVFGKVLFNDVASDVAAVGISASEPGRQVIQNSTRDTYARATKDGYVVTVDD